MILNKHTAYSLQPTAKFCGIHKDINLLLHTVFKPAYCEYILLQMSKIFL